LHRLGVRVVPWVLALIGLAIPLIASGFVVWIPIAGWLVVLGLAWLGSRRSSATRAQEITIALVLLPVLFLLAWEGGWWLIPADVAWLLIVAADRGRREGHLNSPKAQA